MYYSIGKVAAKTGLTVHTLRYYEKEGLLPFVRKSSSGLRMFSDDDLGWLSLIECLKETGMSLKGIKQYIDWFREGDSTLQLKVLAQIEQFQKYLQKIDYKVRLYEEAVKLGSLDKALKKSGS